MLTVKEPDTHNTISAQLVSAPLKMSIVSEQSKSRFIFTLKLPLTRVCSKSYFTSLGNSVTEVIDWFHIGRKLLRISV